MLRMFVFCSVTVLFVSFLFGNEVIRIKLVVVNLGRDRIIKFRIFRILKEEGKWFIVEKGYF